MPLLEDKSDTLPVLQLNHVDLVSPGLVQDRDVVCFVDFSEDRELVLRCLLHVFDLFEQLIVILQLDIVEVKDGTKHLFIGHQFNDQIESLKGGLLAGDLARQLVQQACIVFLQHSFETLGGMLAEIDFKLRWSR